MTTLEHQPQVAEKLEPTVPGLIQQGNAVVAAIGNPENAAWFENPAPNPSLATVSGAVQNLVTTQSAAVNRGKGTVKTRNLAWRALRNYLIALAAWVQLVANSNPGKGSAVIAASGYREKVVGKRTKPDLGASQAQPGAPVLLRGKAGKDRRSFYGWRYMLPGTTTWVVLPNTNVAHTEVTGLPALAMVTFQYQITAKNVAGEWSQPIGFLVH
jgi:hypothetical protein